MTISVLHAFESGKSDGVDATLVQPSNWNEEHVIECATNVLLGRATAGTGAVEEITCTAAGRALLDDAAASNQRTTLGLGTVATLSSIDLTANVTGNLPVTNLNSGTNASARSFFRGDASWGASPLIRGYLAGYGMANNGSDATNDIDIAAGDCADSTWAQVISGAAMTKQLDANWAAGTNAGMRNSAAAITNTTYHIYTVMKADGTQDYYAHTSATAATVLTALQAESGGASYIYARRIGSIVRAGGVITPFSQYGDEFLLKTVVLDINNSTPGTSANTGTLTSLPTGIKVGAIVNAFFDRAADVLYISSLDQNDQAPSGAGAICTIFNDSTARPGSGWIGPIRTNTSAQIRYRATSNNGVTIASVGWIDRRDRDG